MCETNTEPAAPAPPEINAVRWLRLAARLVRLCPGDRTCSSHGWDAAGCVGCGGREVAFQLVEPRGARVTAVTRDGTLIAPGEPYCRSCWQARPTLWGLPHLSYSPPQPGLTWWQLEVMASRRIAARLQGIRDADPA